MGASVAEGGGFAGLSSVIVSILPTWDSEVAGMSVCVGMLSVGVLVGSSSPGPRGVVHCCFALGNRITPAITKLTNKMPIVLKNNFRLDLRIMK